MKCQFFIEQLYYYACYVEIWVNWISLFLNKPKTSIYIILYKIFNPKGGQFKYV
jgi:hypothetical protein